MGNGVVIIFIVASCWLSLGAYLVGASLRRFDASRSLGETIHWLAIVLYALGLGSMALSFVMMIGSREGALEAFGVLAAIVGFPLLLVSVQLYRLRRRPQASY